MLLCIAGVASVLGASCLLSASANVIRTHRETNEFLEALEERHRKVAELRKKIAEEAAQGQVVE